MKKLLILIGIIILLSIGGYVALSFYAVKLIHAHLHKVVGSGLTIDHINVKMTHLSAKGIQYEEPNTKKKLFEIEMVNIYPSLLTLLRGSLEIRECLIVRPSFFFYKSRNGRLTGPWMSSKEESESKGGKERESWFRIKINRLRIKQGSISIDDMGKKIEESPAKMSFRDLDLNIKELQFPMVSVPSPIELKGKMKGRTKDGGIDAKGWIDLKTMDMEMSLKVRDIEVKVFEPYYRKRVSAEIESGHIDMDAKMTVKKKMLKATGQLELVNLQLKEEGTVFYFPAKSLVPLLKKKGNRIKAPFHIQGNMDDPQFNLQETFLTRIAVSLAEALGMPIKVVGENLTDDAGKLKLPAHQVRHSADFPVTVGLLEEMKTMDSLFN